MKYTEKQPEHDEPYKNACEPSEDSEPKKGLRHWLHLPVSTQHNSEDSDKTGRMIWVFAGDTALFVGFVVFRL